jgi:GT2 family glycosyltransferase
VDVTVCVATFGHRSWAELAARAMRSAVDQAPVIHVHGDTLHDARNEALAQVETEWVIHLDADDELEPGYVDAIAAGAADLRAPSVRYVRGARPYAPYVPRVAGHDHACTATCLRAGNWLIVGSAVRAELVREVGGWRDFPWSEDWDLWLRCWLAGASIEAIPAAIYRAHVRADSRNRAPDSAFRRAVHEEIYRANVPDAAAVA